MALTTFDYTAGDDFAGVRSSSSYGKEKFVVYFGAATYGGIEEAHRAAEAFEGKVRDLLVTLPNPNMLRGNGYHVPKGRGYVRAAFRENARSFFFRSYRGGRAEAEAQAAKWRKERLREAYPNMGRPKGVLAEVRKLVKEKKKEHAEMRKKAAPRRGFTNRSKRCR